MVTNIRHAQARILRPRQRVALIRQWRRAFRGLNRDLPQVQAAFRHFDNLTAEQQTAWLLEFAKNTALIRRRRRTLPRWRRDQARMEKADQRFGGMTTTDKIRWLFEFMKRDLRTLRRDERVDLGYDLRALAQTVGVGWMWRRSLGPLSNRALTKVHSAISAGFASLKASAAASLTPYDRSGWLLPACRKRLLRLPAPSRDSGVATATYATYEAASEPSAIEAAIGDFLLHNSRRWRVCLCGCEQSFVANGKRMYLNRKHENAMNQWKRYWNWDPEKMRRRRVSPDDEEG